MTLTGLTPNMERLGNTIMHFLQERALTVKELCEKTGSSRSTIYHVINKLVENGYVINATPGKYRDVKYALGNFEGRRTWMPHILFNGNTVKAQWFLNTTPEESVYVGYKNLFGTLAAILRTAERLHNKKITAYEAGLRLQAQRVQMIKAQRLFTELASIAQQLLDNNVFWDSTIVDKLTTDDEYRPELVENMLKTLNLLNDHKFALRDDTPNEEPEHDGFTDPSLPQGA